GGMQNLGVLPGLTESIAWGVSGDGSTITGVSDSPSGPRRAIIWKSELGMVDLNAYLPTLGIDLTGWTLTNASGASEHGLTIVGPGQHAGHTAGWIAHLGRPRCPGDLDDNHVVGLADLTILLAHFGMPSGATPADGDLDGDADVDLDDLEELLTSFGTT